MHIIKLDLKHGLAFIDSAAVEVDGKSALVGSVAKLCSPPTRTIRGRTRYHIIGKVSVCGQSADCIIEVEKETGFSVTFLFDLIEFFESSILESKVIDACEKALGLKFISSHPSTAFLDPCEWGSATFFYDAKQGDLSLEIKFEPRSKN
jgi:hypothetical protein